MLYVLKSSLQTLRHRAFVTLCVHHFPQVRLLFRKNSNPFGHYSIWERSPAPLYLRSASGMTLVVRLCFFRLLSSLSDSISPNELSFNSVGPWQDIYGFRQGHKTFIMSESYDGGSFANQAHSIVSERDPIEYAKMWKYISHASSDRSLRDHESLIAEVVDRPIDQLGVHSSGEKGTDIMMWTNLTTFDIIGSLAFGQSFGGIESGSSMVRCT